MVTATQSRSTVNTVTYTHLSDARAIIRERLSLRPVVERWWRRRYGTPPLVTAPNPIAFMGRQVATFRYEDALFVRMAEEAGLSPAWFNLGSDWYDERSNFKTSLVEPEFYDSAVGEVDSSWHVRAAPGAFARRRKLRRIRVNQNCFKGIPPNCSLETLHRHQLRRCFPSAIHGDNSTWLGRLGSARNYYTPYLSLFVAHYVLFEDYEGGESSDSELHRFRKSIVLPALAEIEEEFGVSPLVVKLPWWDGLQYFPKVSEWRSHSISLDRQATLGLQL